MIEIFTKILNEKTKRMGIRTAATMADLLNISEDAAYRRIRNPYALRADEMIILAKEFNIDLNQFSNSNTNMLSVEYKALNFETYTSDNFYNELEQRLDHCKFHANSQITYGAKEIPFFYYMWFPALAAFKNFVWNREFLKSPKLNNVSFTVGDQYESRHIKLAEKYLNIVSHEIWGYETLYSTLYQIHHYKECGLFEDERIFQKVLKEYDLLIDLISKLLQKNPAKRLGNMKTGIVDIMKHRWYGSFDWQGLIDGSLESYYIPNIPNYDLINSPINFFDEDELLVRIKIILYSQSL